MNVKYNESRQLTILRILNEKKDWITGKALSEKLGVSDRTIRNDISIINYDIEPYSANIISERGKGYKLECNDNELLISMLSKKDSFQNNNEKRLYDIFLYLLLNSKSILLDDLEDLFYISRSTLENDIKRIKALLSNVHPPVMLIREKNHIQIAGLEISIRFLINEILMMNYNSKKNELEFSGEIFSNEEYIDINNKIKDILLKNKLILNDQNIADITLYLYTAKIRIQNNNTFVGMVDSKFNVENNIENIAKIMFYEIIDYDKLSNEIQEEEIKQLAVKLSFFNICHILEENDTEQINKLPKEITRIVDLLIESIQDDYNLNLKNDEELYMGLIFHIRSLINRIKYHQLSENPILETIKKQYPFIFELSLNIYKIFKNTLNVELSESEVSYVAAHLAAAIERLRLDNSPNKKNIAIISHYVKSYSDLLSCQVKNLCSNDYNIIGPYPTFKLNDILKEDPILILTTCDLDKNEIRDTQVPILKISIEFPYEEQIKILQTISEIKKNSIYNRIPNKFLDNFSEKVFFPKLNLTKKEDVLALMANSMLLNDFVTNDYFKEVLEREELSSTLINNMIAIPHPIHFYGKQNVIGIAIMDEPISWGAGKAQLIFMLSIKREEKNQIREFFKFIECFMNDMDNVNILIKSNNYKDFINNIKYIISNKEKNSH
ncbi:MULTISPECIES: BglG family transcription antiterminator [Anaerofustis]|uniref:BglG family transcription antiterminator n=1 Tax=Anaerofustis TaxID=264995 RepID=UPI0011074B82|nr:MULTISPECIES: BglG family transcription antiterminator [Anaerofustis]MCO8193586.1 BglG family transcription antiterminator [Anaerofustis sp. NSJ-163]